MRNSMLLLVLLTGLAASSQKIRYDEGFLVTKTGDTLRGLIYWKKNAVSTDSLFYKRTETAQPQHFAWTELSDVYNKSTKQKLKIASVRRSFEYIDGNDYQIRYKDSVSVQVIPVIEVYKGVKLSLYYLYDKAPYYFIYDGKQMVQLVQKYRYLTQIERMFDYEKGRRFHITDEYRSLLCNYYDFAEDNKMRYILNNTLYEESSFKTIVSKMDKKLRYIR